MKRNLIGLALAAVVAVDMLSTSAFALAVFGNNSQKGSLLIFPRIEIGDGVDTLITITNDSSLPVLLKCFYATSDPLPTPYTGTAAGARPLKHLEDFSINVTHNQPIAWWASTGKAYSASKKLASIVAPPFGPFPDGQYRTAGEMKCWAITDDGSTQKSHNHLYGTASVFKGGAYEYAAWAFQALASAESATSTPGKLSLNNVDYDACPNILLGNFYASGINKNATQVTLASCNQDLRQNYTPTITRLTWTFWNEDETAFTGTHFCADSWFEDSFPATGFTGLTGLGTEIGYFRIETTADTRICGSDAKTDAYVGVIDQSRGAGTLRGTNLTGRGSVSGIIKYDIPPPDGF